VRSDKCVYSNTSVPMVARPLVDAPSVRDGLKNKLFLGIPVGVSNANARLSANLCACLRIASTAVAFDASCDKGPLRRSNPIMIVRLLVSLRGKSTHLITFLQRIELWSRRKTPPHLPDRNQLSECIPILCLQFLEFASQERY
jgi:hypothetical protein